MTMGYNSPSNAEPGTGNWWNGSAWVDPYGRTAMWTPGQGNQQYLGQTGSWVWPGSQTASSYMAPTQPGGYQNTSQYQNPPYGGGYPGQPYGQSGTGPINLPAGSAYEMLMRTQAFQGQQNQFNWGQQQNLNQQTAQNAQLLEETRARHTAEQNALQRDFEMRQKQVEIDATKYLNQKDADLRLALQNGQISATAAENEKQRNMQEAEFAKTLAFNQLELQQKMDLANLTEKHNYEIQQGGLEVQRGNLANEGRRVDIEQQGADLKKRELEASLAANPVNFVMNELYKRGGTPGTLPANAGVAVGSAASAAGGNPQAPAQAAAVTGGTMGGQPAYDDATLAGIAGSIFGNTGGGPGYYDPNLGGAGIFGSTIRAPNEVSRSQALGMSETERGILESFLRAGVDRGGGRVGVDPNDWWAQQQESLVPTLDKSASRTSYIV